MLNNVVDILTIPNAREEHDGQVGGLIAHPVHVGLSILQFVDNTIILMEHDMEKTNEHDYSFKYF